MRNIKNIVVSEFQIVNPLENWKIKFQDKLKDAYHKVHESCSGQFGVPNDFLDFDEWVEYAFSVKNENADIIKLQSEI